MFDCASAPGASATSAQQARAFEMALLALPAGVAMYDAEQRLVFTNPQFRTLYGLAEANLRPGMPSQVVLQALGAPQPHVLGKPIAEAALAPRILASARGDRVRVTIQSLPDGGWLELHAVERDAGKPSDGLPGEMQPVAARTFLTRAQFVDTVDTQVRSHITGSIIALHSLKFDGLEAVRVEHGATASDMLLRLASKRLKRAVRDCDYITQLSDERFAVLQTGIETQDQVEALAWRLANTLGSPYRLGSSLVNLTVRDGIAIAPQDAKDAESLVDRAEDAMFSMPAGAHRFRLYADARASYVVDREVIARGLDHARQKGELKLYYQPIIDIHRLEVAGFEALMRWQHPELGYIPPSNFIPVAEETGQIIELGAWAVEQACLDAATWNGPYRVSVNFSGQQFGCNDPVSAVRHALDASGLAPHRLEVEVTETALLQNEEIVHRQLSDIQALGVKVALDDFGAAYATLANLRDFHFDKIKIDRSFVGDVPDRKNCAAIVKAVAGLADALDIRSVAEGVETMEQLRQVRASGYSEIQGFYFSVAVPAERVPQTLRECEAKLARLKG